MKSDFLMAIFYGFLAFLLNWEVRDLVWNLWFSSLTTGYAYILINIFVGSAHWLQKVLGSFLYLPFFTIHFCLFHFIHALFLDAFFPLMPENTNRFIQALDENMPLAFLTYGSELVQGYGLYSLILLVQWVPRWIKNAQTTKGGPNFFRPYLNVIRIHLLIFIFAGLLYWQSPMWLYYTIVTTVFLPWEDLRTRSV